MRKALIIASLIGLTLTLLPALLHFYGVIEFEQHKWLTFLGTALYLTTAPFWMNKNKKETGKVK
jgi:hypothetical protein